MLDIEGLKKLRLEILNDLNYSKEHKDFAVKTINKFLLGPQLTNREEEYFNNGYYFGYLLIASQRIENTLKSLIMTVNNQIDKPALGLEDLALPLGVLMKKLFKSFECAELEEKLEYFKKVRNEVVHNLYELETDDLNELENSLRAKMPLSKVLDLQESLLILAVDVANNDPFAKVIKHKLQAQYNSQVPEYRLLVNLS